jgi:hypothetical protein
VGHTVALRPVRKKHKIRATGYTVSKHEREKRDKYLSHYFPDDAPLEIRCRSTAAVLLQTVSAMPFAGLGFGFTCITSYMK